MYAKKTLLVTAMCLNLGLLSGCTSSSGSSNVDPLLEDEEASFFSQSGAVACLTGGFIGLFAGLACDDNPLACAAAGAAVGCGIGMVANYSLDSVRVNYKKLEEQLAATAAYVHEDNERLSNMNTNMQKLIEQDKQELESLERQLTAKSIEGDKLAAKVNDMQANIDYLNKNLAEATSRYNNYVQSRNTLVEGRSLENLSQSERQNLAMLDDKIADMENKILELQELNQSYANTKSVYLSKVS